jgi:UDPglucose 6-dehydrogenase
MSLRLHTMESPVESFEVTVFGAGYVGLVTAACLAEMGHSVQLIEVDRSKLEILDSGQVPFHEPGLAEVVARAVASGGLRFLHPDEMDACGEFVVVAVGTPPATGGAADLRFVRSVVDLVAQRATPGTVVIMKSTVPPGTGARLAEALAPMGVEYASNPEFLREGSAVDDWFRADRIVLGGAEATVDHVAALYEGIDAPIVRCDIASAELIKYASNAFLATKISFANEIARLCDRLDADVDLVMHGVGLDPRIGPAFLKAGIGYGGSCFPKDTKALDYLSSMNGYDFHLLKAVIDVNGGQRLLPIMTLRNVLGDLRGTTIAVAGLTFKPHTDDTREAPALDIIDALLADGAFVRGYDPVGRVDPASDAFEQVPALADAMRDAHAVVIATEWNEIASADWRGLVATMVEPRLVFDGRNCVDGDAVRAGGGTYVGVGRR